jgi:hypothetical protein
VKEFCRETPHTKIIYQPENHLVIISPNDGAVIDLEEYNLEFKLTHELTNGVKAAVLVRTSSFLTVTKDTREESLNPEKEKYIIAQAILVKNLANQLIGNFYIKFQNPRVPNKLFTDEDEALKWLRQKVEEYLKSVEK